MRNVMDPLQLTGVAPPPEAGDAVRTRVDGIVRALAPWHAAHGAYNFLDTPAEADVVLPSASYERLRDIKASYDPDQLIISAHPVRPATERK